PSAIPLRGQDVAVFLRIVEDPAGAAHDAGHGILVEVDGKAGLLLQQHVEAADQRPASRHHDTPIHDVRRQLGWRDLERAPPRVHDLLDRLLHGLPDLARVHPHDLGDPGDEVAPLDLHLALLAHGRGRADLDLDLLRRRLADQEVAVLAHELYDRMGLFVASRTDRIVRYSLCARLYAVSMVCDARR